MSDPGASGRPFAWGLLGSGAVARQFARSIKQLPGHRLRSVASRSVDRARAFQEDLGVETVATSYAQLVDDPLVDAVYVATPAGLHRPHVALAVKAKKPVLCEKPFASTGDEAAEMVADARAGGVFCMEAMWMRYIPAIQALRTAIQGGDIGTPRLLQAELGFNIPCSPDNRLYDPELGGGALLDLGVYPLSLAWFLFGRPVEGRAVITNAPTGVDEQAVISLRHRDGTLSALTCSFSQRLRNSAFVAGTHGSFVVEEPLYSPTRLRFTKSAPAAGPGRPGRLGRIVESQPALVALRRRLAPTLRQLVRGEQSIRDHSFAGYGYQFEAEEVARCVRAGRVESETMPLDETVDLLRAIDALRTTGTLPIR